MNVFLNMSKYAVFSDHELLVMTAADDQDAYAELFDRYWEKMLSVAYSKIRDKDEAEEIVQDIFVSIWCRRQKLSSITSVGHYLAVAVKYQVIKVLARQNLQKKYIEHRIRLVNELTPQTPDWIEFEELKARLGKLVADLPEVSRIVYTLSREEGYTQKQIAEELNITEKAVENRLRRALKSIRSGLDHLLLFLF